MDAATSPLPVVTTEAGQVAFAAPGAGSLIALGAPDAASCVGDFCAIPEHHTQAVVNRKLDEDLV